MEKETKTNSEKTILADEFSKFKIENSNSFPSWVNPNENKLPEIFQNYEYPVSSWPVIIEYEEARMLEALCVKIPRLIQKLPEYYFGNDVKKIADFYFEGNQVITEFAMLAHQKNVEVGCRLDLTLTNNGFKILEANIGSSIGGWQVQSFEHIIRKLHTALENGVEENDLLSKNTQENYIKFLVDNLLQKKARTDQEINIFISLGHVKNIEIRRKSRDFFNKLFKDELQRRGLQGQAFIADYSTIQMKQGQLYMNEHKIHGVIIMSLDREEMPADIFRAFIMDMIYFPDHLGATMYGDKRNLELLRTLAEQQKFSEEENILILNSIPWTRNITKDCNVIFRGKEAQLAEILATHKDEFVIKASNGFQGKDVFIGKFSSDEEWKEAIETAEKTGAFIAQEFCESGTVIAPNKNSEWTPHKLIWGAFGFGKNYGGVWVRMSEEETDVGVINSATGAVEAIVYEKASSEILIL